MHYEIFDCYKILRLVQLLQKTIFIVLNLFNGNPQLEILALTIENSLLSLRMMVQVEHKF